MIVSNKRDKREKSRQIQTQEREADSNFEKAIDVDDLGGNFFEIGEPSCAREPIRPSQDVGPGGYGSNTSPVSKLANNVGPGEEIMHKASLEKLISTPNCNPKVASCSIDFSSLLEAAGYLPRTVKKSLEQPPSEVPISDNGRIDQLSQFPSQLESTGDRNPRENFGDKLSGDGTDGQHQRRVRTSSGGHSESVDRRPDGKRAEPQGVDGRDATIGGLAGYSNPDGGRGPAVTGKTEVKRAMMERRIWISTPRRFALRNFPP
ncbi:hypothetical protein COLO4_16761 [Corchorus olitorius]|uniref:Uncharacterized protein n=1 Tax=Corchorus olitorius TaxID=93759 RepID=A0A1R3JFQ2_9ROSI|nr:hypothetical protein COLO4_16761 [Corchorus olitorius]